MKNQIINRIEKKYILTSDQYIKLMKSISNNIEPDKFYKMTICNIYYDSPNYDLIRKSIDKPSYKEKVRLRCYGIPKLDSEVFIEIKKKYKEHGNKRRVKMTLKEAYDYLDKNIYPQNDSQILREIDYIKEHNELKPALFLAYDREAYIGKDDNLRITFDKNVRSRNHNLRLEYGDEGNLYLSDDCYLMEVKTDNSFPLWFVNELSNLKIYPFSFSKYGNIYKEMLIKKRSEVNV